MKIIRHLNFVCARIKIIGYVGFVSTHVICIWLRPWNPVCTVNSGCLRHAQFVCQTSCDLFLSIVSHITLIIPSNCISGILEQYWAIAWHYKESTCNTFIFVSYPYWASTSLFCVCLIICFKHNWPIYCGI